MKTTTMTYKQARRVVVFHNPEITSVEKCDSIKSQNCVHGRLFEEFELGRLQKIIARSTLEWLVYIKRDGQSMPGNLLKYMKIDYILFLLERKKGRSEPQVLTNSLKR